ncbi:MAG TPA: acyltransferase [Candidatus Sulfotelmatobacter sp.]|nr:acyltransferase [Candidatus Sulfotelmatobacter sp.]
MPGPYSNVVESGELRSPLIRPFMPELDTLRGIAVVAVLLLHAFFWQYAGYSFSRWSTVFLRVTSPGGYGVNLFFVLSGFLITGILLDSKGRPYYYRRFYTRRALRILPPYYALLLLLLVLGSSSAAFVGLSFIYLSNLTNFFGVACDYGPLWSLAIEEHFYLLWPAVVRNLTRRQLAFISGSLVALIPVFRMISFALGYKDGIGWYTWFAADGLAAGSLLAILLRTAVTRKQLWNLCSMLLFSSVLLGIVGQPFGLDTRTRLLGAGFQWTVVHFLCAGILLFFLLLGTSSAKRYVNNSVLRFLGYISYGLYLNHLLAFRMYDRICRHYWPELVPSNGHFGLVVLRFAIGGGCAIAVAAISRKYFEEHFLRLKDSLVPQKATSPADAAINATADTQVA